MISRRTVLSSALFFGTGLAIGEPAFGQFGADLNISPKRLVLDPQLRSAVVYIFNRGSSPASYSIDLVDKAMTPDGQIRNLDEASKVPGGAEVAARVQSSKAMIVFTPRRVSIPGGGSQVVRLRVLRPPGLADGEYRSHLTVSQVPPEDTGLTAEQAAGNESGELSVQITALFAVSIPIIVRQGPLDVVAGIENAAYSVRPAPGDPSQQTGFISLQLVRKGRSSLFGDIEIRRVVRGKPGEMVGGLRGVGVYPEVAMRSVEVALPKQLASGEQVAVIFREEESKPTDYLALANVTVP